MAADKELYAFELQGKILRILFDDFFVRVSMV
jgi:hypothetical protein